MPLSRQAVTAGNNFTRGAAPGRLVFTVNGNMGIRIHWMSMTTGSAAPATDILLQMEDPTGVIPPDTAEILRDSSGAAFSFFLPCDIRLGKVDSGAFMVLTLNTTGLTLAATWYVFWEYYPKSGDA